ncbi:MAG: hypothetical protein LBD72_00465 [Puniceicoccales bacterium]|jgi:hypothetical protein|nr:hypothetical protein [Puniceicoccales bacterium]
MGTSGPLTQSHSAFANTFTGDAHAKRFAAREQLTKAIDISQDDAGRVIRLCDDFDVLKILSDSSFADNPDIKTKIDNLNAIKNNWLDTGTIDRGTAVQLMQFIVGILGEVVAKLDNLKSKIAIADRVRFVSAAVKVVCIISSACAKPNSLLGKDLPSATMDSVPRHVREFGGELAKLKMQLAGINAEPDSMENARKALKGGRQVIGFYGDPKTGKVTFVEVILQNSLWGFGGVPAPKSEADGKPRWRSSTAFAHDWRGGSLPPVLVNLPVSFKDFDNLPDSLKAYDGVARLSQPQQEIFVTAINQKLPEWQDAYKKEDPDGASHEDPNAVVKWAIKQDNIRNAIKQAVAEAGKFAPASDAPPPPNPS